LTAALDVGGRDEGGTSNIRALLGGERHHVIARRAVQLSR